MQSKISLGTVQFGLRYGIANRKGKIPPKEVFEILKYAADSGINCLDTAFAYGDSEDVIGAYLRRYPHQFQVVSKLPSLDVYTLGKAEECLRVTLWRLNIKKLSGYLIHSFENFLAYEDLWGELTCLKKKGLIDRIGFSLYSPNELEILFRKNIAFDLVQVPYSIFDRRFEKYFGILRRDRVEIHARSVFLQGLVFLNPDDCHGHFLKARKQISGLRNLSRDNNISISAICLNFVLLHNCIDKVVIGVDSLSHLEENIRNLKLFVKASDLKHEFDNLIISEENILLPSKWRLDDKKDSNER